MIKNFLISLKILVKIKSILVTPIVKPQEIIFERTVLTAGELEHLKVFTQVAHTL